MIALVSCTVLAAASLSLLLGRLAGPWGWVVGAVGGLVGGPFASFSLRGWGYSKKAAPEESEEGAAEEEPGHQNGPVALGLVGALVGAVAGLPLAGLVMLVWLSVAASPWGSGVWSDGGARAATFSTDDPAVLMTFVAVDGSCALIGAVALLLLGRRVSRQQGG